MRQDTPPEHNGNKAMNRIARNRLRLELGGLAFALKQGATPEEYARHFWENGARNWLKQADTTPREYLRKEAEAIRLFYPWAVFTIVENEGADAELVFTDGCLGGWGRYPWKVAGEFGLTKNDICRYCHEAFSVWATQLGLQADIGPTGEETCRLAVSRNPA